MILLPISLLILAAASYDFNMVDACSQRPLPSDPCTKPYWSEQGVTVAGDGTQGSSNVQLDYPMGIFIDQWDNLYVTDSGNIRIQKFSAGSNNTGVTVAGGWVYEYNRLRSPDDVFVDAADNVFIVDNWNQQVLRWSPGSTPGTILAEGGDMNFGQYTLHFFGVTGNQQDAVYISHYIEDTYNAVVKIMKYSTDSKPWSPTLVATFDSFVAPKGLIVDQCDNVYLADGSDKILKFNNGTSVSEIVVSGLYDPTDVTIDKYGNIYIVEQGADRLQRFSLRDGTMEVIVGSETGQGENDAEQLRNPFSLAFDSKNNLYVSDTFNHRVQRFDFQGGDLFC